MGNRLDEQYLLWDEGKERKILIDLWWKYRAFLIKRIPELEKENDNKRRTGMSYKERKKRYSDRMSFARKEIGEVVNRINKLREERLSMNDLVLYGEERLAGEKGMEWYLQNTYQYLPVQLPKSTEYSEEFFIALHNLVAYICGKMTVDNAPQS